MFHGPRFVIRAVPRSREIGRQPRAQVFSRLAEPIINERGTPGRAGPQADRCEIDLNVFAGVVAALLVDADVDLRVRNGAQRDRAGSWERYYGTAPIWIATSGSYTRFMLSIPAAVNLNTSV